MKLDVSSFVCLLDFAIQMRKTNDCDVGSMIFEA